MTDPALWRSHMQEEGEPAATAYACVYPPTLSRISMRAAPPIHAANYYRKRRNSARVRENWLPLDSVYTFRSQGGSRGGSFCSSFSRPSHSVARSLFFFFFFLRSAHFTRDWYRGIIETRRGLCALPTCSFRGNNWISFLRFERNRSYFGFRRNMKDLRAVSCTRVPRTFSKKKRIFDRTACECYCHYY